MQRQKDDKKIYLVSQSQNEIDTRDMIKQQKRETIEKRERIDHFTLQEIEERKRNQKKGKKNTKVGRF